MRLILMLFILASCSTLSTENEIDGHFENDGHWVKPYHSWDIK